MVTVSAEQVQFYRKPEQFGLALSTVPTSNGSEAYIHIKAPASSQWAAVGTADAMDGSLMFVMFPGEDEDGNVEPSLTGTRLTEQEVTFSVRSAHGHHEPQEVEIDVDVLSSGIQDGVMQATAKWKLPDSSTFSTVDITSKKQPWIWAIGPSEDKNVEAKGGKSGRSLEHKFEQHSSYGELRQHQATSHA